MLEHTEGVHSTPSKWVESLVPVALILHAEDVIFLALLLIAQDLICLRGTSAWLSATPCHTRVGCWMCLHYSALDGGILGFVGEQDFVLYLCDGNEVLLCAFLFGSLVLVGVVL